MARQQESCWNFGVAWRAHGRSPTSGRRVRTVGPVATMHLGLERWFDEGGSVDTEPDGEPAVAVAER
jgi:hypothetical protein